MTNNEKLAKRMHKHKGSFKRMSEESGVSYSSVRKLACCVYERPSKAMKQKINDWLRANK